MGLEDKAGLWQYNGSQTKGHVDFELRFLLLTSVLRGSIPKGLWTNGSVFFRPQHLKTVMLVCDGV